MLRRNFIAALSALGGLVPISSVAQQKLDTGRILVGFSPGGTADTLARKSAELLRDTYARTIVVENRTGAGGRLAGEATKAATPDGSAMLLTPASILTIYPFTYSKLPYDPVRDFSPVSMGFTCDFGFGVGPGVPTSVTDVPSFVDWWKANRDKASFGTGGAGALPHFLGLLLEKSAGVGLRHVGYRGSAPAVQDVIAGHIPAASAPLGEFLQYHRTGKLRLIAVSGQRRSKLAPEVPTFFEQGFKEVVGREWFSFFLPGGAPTSVVEKVGGPLRQALAQPEMLKFAEELGFEATPSTAEDLRLSMRAELDRWGPIVRASGFRADS